MVGCLNTSVNKNMQMPQGGVVWMFAVKSS
jgi:hypothetical protein